MARYKQLKINLVKNIPYSSSMDCVVMQNGDIEIFVSKPWENVQTDAANFESIVFSIWSCNPDIKIVLKYNSMLWCNSFPIDTHHNKKGQQRVPSELQHYMRFLYRAYKMKSLYNNFTICQDNILEVNKFGDEFEVAKAKGNLCVTIPKSKSTVTTKRGISENHLEKWFVIESRKAKPNKVVEKLQILTGVKELYDQHPCGLFYGNDSNEINRIFNTGYFDLWGVNGDKELCIFELKKEGNIKLGIISELFLYSCLAQDFRSIKSQTNTSQRGFDKFRNTTENIIAYFLAPQYHPFMEANIGSIIKAMNLRADGVSYGCLKFKCSKIYDSNNINGFITKLTTDWQNVKY